MSRNRNWKEAGRFAGGPLVTRMLGLALATAVLVSAPAAQAASCTPEQGQAFIDTGRLEHAVREFTCVIDAQPTAVEGYRGRIEADLLLGRYSDALGDVARITARVLPVHPDAEQTVLAHYAERLAVAPDDVAALTGASFAQWSAYDYVHAIPLLDRLLEVRPDDVYGNLFRGSSHMLRGKVRGAADLERALSLAPDSPDVRFIVADAYTYGVPDLERAFAEASLALDGGLDTPRVHAILAAAYNTFGDLLAGATHIRRHLELVTTEVLTAPALTPGETLGLDLVPGRTYAIPVAATAGETISISTSSRDIWDSIALLLAPDGSPVVGSDDANAYFAEFEWVADETATYMLHVTSFEAVSTGELDVTRLG
jgi:tetratricopeptide (TPR) repeat protein